VQTVPDSAKSEAVIEIVAYFRAMLAQVDASLISEWESMLAPSAEEQPAAIPVRVRPDITKDTRAFRARIRAELHRLVKALADKNYEEASACIWQPPDGQGSAAWSVERLSETLEPFYDMHERLVFDHRARLAELTFVKEIGPRIWQVQQTLVDPEEENLWAIEAEIHLTDPQAQDGPLLQLVRIGT
jgi:hypothetical protein